MTQVVDLQAVQAELEEEAMGMGIDRYRKALARGEADMEPGVKLLKRAIEPLAAAIKEYVATVSAGNARKNASVVKWLSQFTPEAAAFVTARQAINAMTKKVPLQKVALGIASLLEDTLSYEELRINHPGLYRQLQRKIEKTSGEKYRHIVLRRQEKFAGIETIRWEITDKVKLGQILLHLMQHSTSLIEVIQVRINKHDAPYLVVPTQETLDWLEKSHARCELLSPVFMPMVVPPRPWKGPFNGGYLAKKLRFPLVKTANRNYLEELRSVDMPKVYTAINALQDTAWCINKAVLNVMREVWDGGGRLGGLPPRDPLELPSKNFKVDAPGDDPDVKVWKKKAALVYEDNVRLISKRIAMSSKLWLGEKFAEYERIYFPHALDWRGRAYPVSSFVSPQSDDSGKALLQFATSQPLGENGAFWLAVHGANCFGVDKVTFADRVKWVQDNQDAIMDSALNPLDGKRFWSTADAPYQFLAFCFEWTGLVTWTQAGRDQADYHSSIAVGLDGSCNGLQNFSAMLRDEVGGKATNLVPSDFPSDIYAEVAKASQALVDADAAGGDVVAQRWVGKITRRLVKRNTMTSPYAVSRYGMRDQLSAEFRKMKEDAPDDYEGNFEDAQYLASKNYEAIGTTVVAARSAMEWLRAVAQVVAKDGLPIRWTAPSGMLVSQDYRAVHGRRFESYITGRRVQLTLAVDSVDIDKRRMSAGISPNVVHSLDAAHMVSTVNQCLDEGVDAFSMVHDSFGTHAGKIDVLAQELRSAFVNQYTDDVLGRFRAELVAQVPAELAELLPPVPPFGSLQLGDVHRSEYFFA
jgi:DNA-directed RNA polymerase